MRGSSLSLIRRWRTLHFARVLSEAQRRSLYHAYDGNGCHHRVCRQLHDRVQSPNHFEFEAEHAKNFRHRHSINFRPESPGVARVMCAGSSMATAVVRFRVNLSYSARRHVKPAAGSRRTEGPSRFCYQRRRMRSGNGGLAACSNLPATGTRELSRGLAIYRIAKLQFC